MSSRKTTTAVFSTNSAPIKLAPRKAPKRTEEEKAMQTAIIDKQLEADRLAAAKAEVARANAALKAARETEKAEREAKKAERATQAAARKAEREQRAANRLSAEDAKQREGARWHRRVVNAARRRIAAGETQEQAIEGVLAALREMLVARLAEQPTANEATSDEE